MKRSGLNSAHTLIGVETTLLIILAFCLLVIVFISFRCCKRKKSRGKNNAARRKLRANHGENSELLGRSSQKSLDNIELEVRGANEASRPSFEEKKPNNKNKLSPTSPRKEKTNERSHTPSILHRIMASIHCRVGGGETSSEDHEMGACSSKQGSPGSERSKKKGNHSPENKRHNSEEPGYNERDENQERKSKNVKNCQMTPVDNDPLRNMTKLSANLVGITKENDKNSSSKRFKNARKCNCTGYTCQKCNAFCESQTPNAVQTSLDADHDARDQDDKMIAKKADKSKMEVGEDEEMETDNDGRDGVQVHNETEKNTRAKDAREKDVRGKGARGKGARGKGARDISETNLGGRDGRESNPRKQDHGESHLRKSHPERIDHGRIDPGEIDPGKNNPWKQDTGDTKGGYAKAQDKMSDDTLEHEVTQPPGNLKSNIGDIHNVVRYAREEWKSDTETAKAVREGYFQIPAQLGLQNLRVIRGDNYCAIRATLFQTLVKKIPIRSELEHIAEIPKNLQSSDCGWIEDWTFGSRLTVERDKVCEEMENCLKELAKLVSVNEHMNSEEGRVSHLLSQFNFKPELEIRLLEAVKILMLFQAIQLYRKMRAGEDIPIFAMIMFARDTSEDPWHFMMKHLNAVGDTGGLEQVEMHLLGYTLGIKIKVVRPAYFGQPDFIASYPEDMPDHTPLVALIAEDDRHYNILS